MFEFKVEIITRDNKVEKAYLNKPEKAQVELHRLNLKLEESVEDVWLYYELEEIVAHGLLDTQKQNRLSILMRNGMPTYCYLNNLKKCENDYARLVKDGDEYITYEIIRNINLEV